MLNKSVPKLLQEANEVKKALEKIGERIPEGLTAADMETKIAELEGVVDEVDALNADRTRLVNQKGEKSRNLSDHIVQVRSAIKGIFGADSSEYDMVGGTRTSERKHHPRNAEQPEAGGEVK